MQQFLADIAGMLEIFAVAGGLILWHRARTEESAAELKLAAVVLVAGGLLVGLCTTWYWLDYRAAGMFEPAHAHPHMRAHAPAVEGHDHGSVP